jgi:hypothetical protein
MKSGAIWRIKALTDSHVGFPLRKVDATTSRQRQHFIRFNFDLSPFFKPHYGCLASAGAASAVGTIVPESSGAKSMVRRSPASSISCP